MLLSHRMLTVTGHQVMRKNVVMKETYASWHDKMCNVTLDFGHLVLMMTLMMLN